MSRRGRAGGLGLAALASLASPGLAMADITAVVDSDSVGRSAQMSRVDAVSGAAIALPGGINDPTQDQLHPSLSPDGRRLVFERTGSAGTRIIMVDLQTGQRADLFSGFETAADPPSTPTFSSDGTAVITGRRFEHRDPSSAAIALQASFTVTDVTGFPNGPFPKQIVSADGPDLFAAGRTLQPTALPGGTFAFGIGQSFAEPLAQIGMTRSGATAVASDPNERLANPTVSEVAGVVVFEHDILFAPTLGFRPLAGFATAATAELPSIVNAPGTVVKVPEFSRDGRFLAFRRRSQVDGKQRIFVWDTQTQLLLNPHGVLAPTPNESGVTVDDSAIALHVKPVLKRTFVTPGTVGVTVADPTGVGIIVQRVVGRTRVLGRSAPQLRLVGRVPLGTFRSGAHRIPWDGRVGGRRLAPGRYLVTVRAVTGAGRVRDLGRPVRLRIR